MIAVMTIPLHFAQVDRRQLIMHPIHIVIYQLAYASSELHSGNSGQIEII
jgi:hypothetical protein